MTQDDLCLTGAWLVVDGPINRLFHGDVYESSEGDIGLEAALAAGREALPEDAHVHGLTLPVNGRGVYQVYGEIETVTGTDAAGGEIYAYSYPTVFVNPGTGEVNGVQESDEGLSWWLYRGHMYLWQDDGLFGMFDPESGWCRALPVGEPDADGVQPMAERAG